MNDKYPTVGETIILRADSLLCKVQSGASFVVDGRTPADPVFKGSAPVLREKPHEDTPAIFMGCVCILRELSRKLSVCCVILFNGRLRILPTWAHIYYSRSTETWHFSCADIGHNAVTKKWRLVPNNAKLPLDAVHAVMGVELPEAQVRVWSERRAAVAKRQAAK